jgi:hypothetical protein
MTKIEIEKTRDELFEDGHKRGQQQVEKLTAGIQAAEAEASYPVSIRLQLEKQRQLLRDILIEGNNLLPWREPATNLDELKKELSIYAGKRHSKSPGDSFADYAFDIVRRIKFYRDQEALIKIEMGQVIRSVEGTDQTEKYKLSEIINEIANEDCYFGFDNHIDYLVEKGYLKIDENCLIWKRGGSIMLAAYFGMLQEHHNPMKKHKWAHLEKIFKVYTEGKLKYARNLAQQYKDFEDVKKCKSKKHDKEYKELKALIEGKIRNTPPVL